MPLWLSEVPWCGVTWKEAAVQPHNEFRFHPQVVQIGCYWGSGGHTELYLLEGDTLAIVDTGVNGTPSRYIAPALESYGRRLGDVDLILNTHGHHDHAGGNAEMVAASGATVWIHEADARVAEDPDYQFDAYFANNDLLVGRPDRLEASRAALKVTAGQPAKVDRKLADGEVLELGKGIKLEVLHTPGHTRGSVCYYWEAEGLAFCGDSVMGQGSRPGGLPLIYFPADYERSIDRLLRMDMAALGLGHHYRTHAVPRDSVHFGPHVTAYLRASREIADLIGDSLRRAAAARPEAGFLEVARAATDLAAARLPITKGEDGLPVTGSVAAFYGYWQLRK
jgi:glyoxylase-like metal-dependent hydrolase (beta-lactamase superfamily II)